MLVTLSLILLFKRENNIIHIKIQFNLLRNLMLEDLFSVFANIFVILSQKYRKPESML